MSQKDDFIKIEVLGEEKEASKVVEQALAARKFKTTSVGATLGVEYSGSDKKCLRVGFSGIDSPGTQVVDKKACLELAEFFRQAAEYVK